MFWNLNSRAKINLNFNFLNKISGSKDQFAFQFIPSCNHIIQKYKVKLRNVNRGLRCCVWDLKLKSIRVATFLEVFVTIFHFTFAAPLDYEIYWFLVLFIFCWTFYNYLYFTGHFLSHSHKYLQTNKKRALRVKKTN